MKLIYERTAMYIRWIVAALAALVVMLPALLGSVD